LYQDIVKINRAIASGDFFHHPDIINACHDATKHNKRIHIMGLCSDGGVHSHIDHLRALADAIHRQGQSASFHLFLDGRDTAPDSGIGFVETMQKDLHLTPSRIGSLIGRYRSMDRDHRRERVAQAYHLLVNGTGIYTDDVVTTLRAQYDA